MNGLKRFSKERKFDGYCVSSIIFWILFLMCLIITCNCAISYKLYQGEELPKEELAILSCVKESPVRLEIVDGKRPSKYQYYGERLNPFIWGLFGDTTYDGFIIELLPGKHTLSIGYIWASDSNYVSASARSVQNINLEFEAHAGHRYTIEVHGAYSVDGKSGSWSAEVVDLGYHEN